TSNGFKPSIYNLSNDFKSLKKIYSYNINSNNLTSIFPIGLQGEYFFYFSNLDPSKGRELYKFKVDLNTSSNEIVENEPLSVHFNNSTLMFSSANQEQIYEYEIFSLDGKKITNGSIKHGEEKSLNIKQTLVLVKIKNPTNKFFKTFVKFIR
ncbi:MAG: hypothetical protein RLZZ546_2133, partial [Bacteroidota bacterium]